LDLVPKAARVAVLVNPANANTAEATLQGVQDAARIMGLQIYVLNATTSREIDAAFATFGRERGDDRGIAEIWEASNAASVRRAARASSRIGT
jgi:hypothetical protein